MKRLIQTAVLICSLSAIGRAGLVAFSQFDPAENITDGFAFTTAVYPSGETGGVRIGYSPEDISFPPCGFLPGQPTGLQTSFDCVGAEVNSSGIIGTTEGVYTLDFDIPATGLFFNFGMFSILPDATIAENPFTVFAFFEEVAGNTSITRSGQTETLSYVATSGITHAELRFFPSDPSLSSPPAFGQTIVGISEVQVIVPEPATLILFGAGFAALLVGRTLKRWR